MTTVRPKLRVRLMTRARRTDDQNRGVYVPGNDVG